MILRLGPSLESYLKTTIAAVAVATAALMGAWLAIGWLTAFFAVLVATPLILFALAAAAVALAGLIVLLRQALADREAEDLFLRLNRSRDPAAIAAAALPRPALIQRWITRRLLGSELLVGDIVEVKPWAEVQATLDSEGCLEGLPFMPEMLPMCGHRAIVFRRMHRLFDYRKSRRMRHMKGTVLLVGAVCNGSRHGGCEAACHTIWKSAWIRRVDARASVAAKSAIHAEHSGTESDILTRGTFGPTYTCQLTQLHEASVPLDKGRPGLVLAPVVCGNVAPAAFIVGWLTHFFNNVQHWRQGVSFPAFESVRPSAETPEETSFTAGDAVCVRTSAEIRATVNDRMMHRGLWLEPDMLKHCGRCYVVEAEIRKVIDIVTGEMLAFKTSAYTLRGVHFSGERQLFNAQHEPLFWRSLWLQREKK